MVQLKALLTELHPGSSKKLELTSGRRPRMLDGGDMKLVGDEILNDEQVLDLCRAWGGRNLLDDLGAEPVEWTTPGPRGPVRIRVAMKGREVAAVFSPANAAAQSPRERPEPARVAKSQAPPADAPSSRRSQPARRLTRPPRRPSAQDVRFRRAEPEPRSDPAATQRKATVPDKQAYQPAKPRVPTPAPARPDRPSTRPASKRRSEAALRVDVPKPEPPPPLRVDPARPEPAPRVDPARPEPAPRLDPPKPEPPPARALAVNVPDPGKRAEPRSARAVDPWLRGILELARDKHASDVHLTTEMPPVLRIHGELREVKTISTRDQIERGLRSILPERNARELEATGGTCFAVSVSTDIRARVNATRTYAGPKVAVRLVRPAAPTLDSLGLPSEAMAAISQPQGLVVVVGSAGHGKTTTLAALVDWVNGTRAVHILLIEDPIEIPISSKTAVVSQREVGTHASSFHRALEGALRQDPDVIAVGELRDVETVRMALSASETGHLVIATMNAPSASRAIARLIEVFPIAEQPQVRATLAGGLRLILCQHLVPTLGGGRTAALEIVPGSVPLWNLIRDDKLNQLPSLMQRGKGVGIVTLEDSLRSLAGSGTISEEVLADLLADAEGASQLKPDNSPPAAPLDAPEEPSGQEEFKLGNLLTRAGAFLGRKGGS